MRRELIRAVSSALLLVMMLSTPHHDLDPPVISSSSSQVYYAGLMVSEFYPCALRNDEYLVISNQCGLNVNLFHFNISDGEGRLMIVADLWLMRNESLSISWNSSSFFSAYSQLPNLSIGSEGVASLISASGTFRLGDAGDSIALSAPDGDLVDFVRYGTTNDSSPSWIGDSVPGPKNGEVVKRIRAEGRLLDSNSSADWLHFREFRYGYTELPPGTFLVGPGNLTAFTSPDSSLEVLLDLIGSTSVSLSLCSYEFSSIPIASAMTAAAKRGTSNRLLVDGSPAGGMNRDEIACLSVLAKNNVDVRTIRGNASRDVVQHFGALHAKYLVVDHLKTVVLSENFVEQGTPTDRLFGNRGWGVCVADRALARFVEGMFYEDSRLSRLDVIPWREDTRWDPDAVLPAVPESNHTRGFLDPMRSTSPALIDVFASPDSSLDIPYICRMIESSGSVLAEQFQADLFWEQRWSGASIVSPIVADILSITHRGGSARVLFDSSWFNLNRNGAVVSSLRENSTLEGLDGQFSLMDTRNPALALHNKGAVFDGKRTLVSSNNWVTASFAKNRELGLLIDSCEVADYFSMAFELDWRIDELPPVADAGPDQQIAQGEVAVLSANSSSDNRAIADISWDIDGDGQSESRNSSAEFIGLLPGTFRVVLTVKDSWGNTATDEVVITVIHGGTAVPARRDSPADGIAWLAPLIFGLAVLVYRRIRGPRVPPDSRKVNHRPCT